jgi:Schlafen, AlbA_2
MLYTKNILEITWEDVKDFCDQKNPEGATLDYKKDFPSDLAKSIGAFANTMGGLILIGIDEDNNNKPITPIEGISNTRGLSERVMSIILSNITPPIIPEIQVCINDDESKAIIVIRIHQSELTPHAVNNNTKVYVRTGNRRHAESLVDLEKLHWLLNNRQKSIQLSENISKEATKRFNKYYQKELKESVEKSEINDSNKVCKLSLVISPRFPHNILCDPPELKHILNDIYISDYFGTSDEFPINKYNPDVKIHQSGIHGGRFYKSHAYYFELNHYGFYLYNQHLFGSFPIKGGENERIFRFNEIIARLDQVLQSSSNFYDKLGFNGLLKFEISLSGISDFQLRPFIKGDLKNTYEESCRHVSSFLVNNLRTTKKDIIFSAIQNIAWAYNWEIEPKYFDFYEMKIHAL